MSETSLTLIDKVQAPVEARTAWGRFEGIYKPLIEHWLLRLSVSRSDVDDLVQEVMLAVVEAVPKFQHNGRIGAFRKWLWQITHNRCRRYWDKRCCNASGSDTNFQLIQTTEDEQSRLTRIWEEHHDRHLMEKLMAEIHTEFSDEKRSVFQMLVQDNRSAMEVAEHFEIPVARVYRIKTQIIGRLKARAQTLFDEI